MQCMLTFTLEQVFLLASNLLNPKSNCLLTIHNEVQVIWKHLMTQLNKTTTVLKQSKHLGQPHCSSVGRSVCQNECQKLSKTRFQEYLWLSNCTVTLTQMNSFSLALKEKKEKPGVKVGAPPKKQIKKLIFNLNQIRTQSTKHK